MKVGVLLSLDMSGSTDLKLTGLLRIYFRENRETKANFEILEPNQNISALFENKPSETITMA